MVCEVVLQHSAHQPLEITLRAAVWVVNKTSLKLSYYDATASGAASRLPVSLQLPRLGSGGGGANGGGGAHGSAATEAQLAARLIATSTTCPIALPPDDEEGDEDDDADTGPPGEEGRAERAGGHGGEEEEGGSVVADDGGSEHGSPRRGGRRGARAQLARPPAGRAGKTVWCPALVCNRTGGGKLSLRPTGMRLVAGGTEQALRMHDSSAAAPPLCLPFTTLPRELRAESEPFSVDVSGDSGEVRIGSSGVLGISVSAAPERFVQAGSKVVTVVPRCARATPRSATFPPRRPVRGIAPGGPPRPPLAAPLRRAVLPPPLVLHTRHVPFSPFVWRLPGRPHVPHPPRASHWRALARPPLRARAGTSSSTRSRARSTSSPRSSRPTSSSGTAI